MGCKDKVAWRDLGLVARVEEAFLQMWVLENVWVHGCCATWTAWHFLISHQMHGTTGNTPDRVEE